MDKTFSADSIKYDFWKTVAMLFDDKEFIVKMAAAYLNGDDFFQGFYG